jgi:hypothetical protein
MAGGGVQASSTADRADGRRGSVFVGSADRWVELDAGDGAERWARRASLLAGDLARVRRRERVRGGHLGWSLRLDANDGERR